MRILLTSDLHGVEEAFHAFSKSLADGYDIGVMAGDLLDDKLTAVELSQLMSEPEDHDDLQTRTRRGLLKKERRIIEVLQESRKPILVVPGNHDTTPLATDGTFINLHLKKFDFDGVPFVGYGCLSRTLGPDLQMASLNEIEDILTEQTILVTHIPPRGTMDLKMNYRQMESFGSGILAEFVRRKRPRFHFFGDAHDSVGARGTSVNASYPLVSSFCGVDTDSGDIWTERTE